MVKAKGSGVYLLITSPNENGSFSDVKDLNIAKYGIWWRGSKPRPRDHVDDKKSARGREIY